RARAPDRFETPALDDDGGRLDRRPAGAVDKGPARQNYRLRIHRPARRLPLIAQTLGVSAPSWYPILGTIVFPARPCRRWLHRSARLTYGRLHPSLEPVQ